MRHAVRNWGSRSAVLTAVISSSLVAIGAVHAESPEPVSNGDIEAQDAGLYEVAYGRAPSKADDARNVVYWLPADEAASADVPDDVATAQLYDEVIDILQQPDTEGAAFVSADEIDIYVDDAAARASARAKRRGARRIIRDPDDCPNGAVCLYQHQNFNGDWAVISGSNDWVNVTGNMNNKTTSVVNQRANDSKLAEYPGGGGDKRCLDSGERVREYTGAFNDTVSSVRRLLVDSAC